VRGLRGKTETARDKRRLALDLHQRCDQRAAFQSFFQGPGGICGIARLHQEKKGGVEAEAEKAGSIRAAPFPRHLIGEAPQHQIAALNLLGRLLGNQGKRKTERRRAVAVGFGPDLMKTPAFQLAQGPRGVILRPKATLEG
jgi:hypothetical protein